MIHLSLVHVSGLRLPPYAEFIVRDEVTQTHTLYTNDFRANQREVSAKLLLYICCCAQYVLASNFFQQSSLSRVVWLSAFLRLTLLEQFQDPKGNFRFLTALFRWIEWTSVFTVLPDQNWVMVGTSCLGTYIVKKHFTVDFLLFPLF